MLRGHKRYVTCVFLLIAVLFLPLTSYAKHTQQTGFVRSGENPIVSSKVTLYQTGGSHPSSVEMLGTARTDETGFFKISFKLPNSRKTILYLIADGGSVAGSEEAETLSENTHGWSGWKKKWGKKFPQDSSGHHDRDSGPIRFATVLGKSPTLNDVVLNELTTVATAYTLAQFINGKAIKGRAPGLGNAADILQANLVNVYTGEVAEFLTVPPNGRATSTWRTFN